VRLNLIGPFVVNAPFGTEIAFSKGLKQLGHEVNEVDPNVTTYTPEDADVTIVFKTCVGNEGVMLSYLKHPVITYQPDDARFPHIREMMMRMRGYSDLFLSFDEYGSTVARSMGYRAAEELLLTADPELYSPSPLEIERDIDVSFIGSWADPAAHASRRKMIQIVQAEADRRGWKTHWEMSQDIPHVVDVYRRSKVVLNHATDVGQPFGAGCGLQCRHFEVGMTKTCILSNWMYTQKDLYFPQYNDEAKLLWQLDRLLCGDPAHGWAAEGTWLYSQIQQRHMPLNRAEQLIDFIERNT
jgi:hypothetical protein